MSDLPRHDIPHHVWETLKSLLPGCKGNKSRRGANNRLFLSAVLWKLRTGCPWRALPSQYGRWGTVRERFRSWGNAGVREKLLDLVADDPDLEWLIIDASHIKVHPHAAGAKGETRIRVAPKVA